MRAVFAWIRSHWRGLRRPAQLDAEMQEEMRFHIEMEAERLIRQDGLEPEEARRRAAVAFGGVEKYRGASRDALGFTWTRGLPMDLKLAVRMLLKYPGLTLAGGLALAISIGIGAAWFDFARGQLQPTLPFADGHRIVEIEMRDAARGTDERRLLHDFTTWRREARLLEDLGAYRTVERNLLLGDARPEPVTVAEMTASGFRIASVPPLLGRPLLEADEQPGAPTVVVLGYSLWQQRFGGQADVIGRTVRLGRTTTTVVGVMPQGFAFPVNHRLWVALQRRAAGYAPLDGQEIRVFGRLAADATPSHAHAEIVALTRRAAAVSPATHEHLRVRVLPYGRRARNDGSWYDLAVTHLPVLLVLIVACTNVGTLVYARTALRDAEIAMRYALGASRARIVAQLFVEALVLASVAAGAGLAAAHAALSWGARVFYSGSSAGAPFWSDPGLELTTVLYAAGLTVAGAVILGLIPALKITGRRVQPHLRTVGGSTLRFGGVWTAAMIAQVALTVICIPPAIGVSHEAVRDHLIRRRFPAHEYLAVRVGLDRESGLSPIAEESDAAFAARFDRTYREVERRVAGEPDVLAVTFGDGLPGMSPAVRRAEVEGADGEAPTHVPNLWSMSIGPKLLDSFGMSVSAGRDFHDGDRAAGARTVLVNEAFARRYTGGTTPVGRRLRYASEAASPEPWLEIVGMVRDIGMTPTDDGEAPYVFHAAAPSAVTPLVMGVRVAREPEALAARLRTIAADVDPGLRVDDVRPLDQVVWRTDVSLLVGAGAFVAVVCLGLFLSAAGIFSLTSVSVARRTREIGLRSALGASPGRILRGIVGRALVLIGSGVAAGNLVVLLVVVLDSEVELSFVTHALLTTSAVMLGVGVLACLEPARRALRIQPVQALKES
jgi:predicted permease